MTVEQELLFVHQYIIFQGQCEFPARGGGGRGCVGGGVGKTFLFKSDGRKKDFKNTHRKHENSLK